jgi:DNA invertase Pin-like site-specific DNA recombinase
VEYDESHVTGNNRWGRSVADLVSTLQELADLGVGFVSLTEALDLTMATGRAMAGLLAVFADNAEGAIMQSHSVEAALRPAFC